MTIPDNQIPYSDPIRDVLDALESSIEQPSCMPPDPWSGDGDLMGNLGRPLGAVEMSIEDTLVPPAEPVGVELIAPASEPVGPLSQGASEGPPLEPEPGRLDWISLNPPVAARPFFMHEGLGAPPAQSRGRGGTGIRNSAGSRGRWCPKERCTVDEEEYCPSCHEWGDHGSGFEQCYYDWLDEGRETDKADEGDGE